MTMITMMSLMQLLFLLLLFTIIVTKKQVSIAAGLDFEKRFQLQRRKKTPGKKTSNVLVDAAAAGATMPFGDSPYLAFSSTNQQFELKPGQSKKKHNGHPKHSNMAMTDAWKDLLQILKSIFLYKPPIGATAFLVVSRLLTSRKSAAFFKSIVSDEAEKQEGQRRKRKPRRGRALALDSSDRCYDQYGGVLSVRAEICAMALSSSSSFAPSALDEDNETTTSTSSAPSPSPPFSVPWTGAKMPTQISCRSCVDAVLDALSIASRPRVSRDFFVERMAQPLSHLQNVLQDHQNQSMKGTRSPSSSTSNNKRNNQGRCTSPKLCFENVSPSTSKTTLQLVTEGAKIAEVRTLDALLRILRDQLLISSSRLNRSKQYWSRRVHWHEGFGILWKFMAFIRSRTFKGTNLEDDRMNLAIATAMYNREIETLGKIQRMLLQRPKDLQPRVLLDLLQEQNEQERTEELVGQQQQQDEQGFLSGIMMDMTNIGSATRSIQPSITKRSSAAATRVLLKPPNSKEQQVWIDEATEWTQESRRVIGQTLFATMSGLAPQDQSTESRKRNATVEQDSLLLDNWCSYAPHLGLETWKSILTLIESYAKSRRIRERHYLIFAGNAKEFLQRYDILGIPSSSIIVMSAMWTYDLVKPHWSQIVTSYRNIWEIVWSVIRVRFYKPVRGIADDLFLKNRPRMVSPDLVSNEQISLDNMLRDLGVGDGTAGNRNEAVKKASRLYEEELKSGGPIKFLIRGNVIRLLLIQVQQLKAGLLKAMDSIDDLVQSNRLNVQLLALTPAVLLVLVASRVFFGTLYRLRTRDIRPVREIHAEMTDYLNQMEKRLLLANHEYDADGAAAAVGVDADGRVTATRMNTQTPSAGEPIRVKLEVLQPSDLGELLRLVHSYLILLDYLSPHPFPSQLCDSIHTSLQDLLTLGQLQISRQLDLLRLVQSAHVDLLKSN